MIENLQSNDGSLGEDCYDTNHADFVDEDEEITAYCIDSLENGHTVFVNDVLVKVNEADV